MIIGLVSLLNNTAGDQIVRDPMTSDEPKDWYTVLLG